MKPSGQNSNVNKSLFESIISKDYDNVGILTRVSSASIGTSEKTLVNGKILKICFLLHLK
jgi:hypothetical protein